MERHKAQRRNHLIHLARRPLASCHSSRTVPPWRARIRTASWSHANTYGCALQWAQADLKCHNGRRIAAGASWWAILVKVAAALATLGLAFEDLTLYGSCPAATRSIRYLNSVQVILGRSFAHHISAGVRNAAVHCIAPNWSGRSTVTAVPGGVVHNSCNGLERISRCWWRWRRACAPGWS